jgi:glycyl-tRNA synthetase beta chain
MSTRDVLFELGTEELPPRGLDGLSAALADHLQKSLDGAGIAHGVVRRFATPRRLAVLVESCAEYSPDRQIERRGPPLANAFDASGEPTQAAIAFARSCGVAPAELETLRSDKGAWLVYRGTERGAATASLLGGFASAAVAALPIARRMRWGAGAAEFVRPVHWVVLLFGADVVPCELLGRSSGRTTFGHRFHAPRAIKLSTARRYPGALRRARVVADFAERRELIRTGVLAAAAEVAGRALIDAQLLDEVTALVEWPVALAGRFEDRFLRLPREVVIATVQDHQRYFPVESADGGLNGFFITVCNIQSRDPAVVRAGNERVVRPRLSDAAFFWDQDTKMSLDSHAARLGGVTFQTKLGTYADKTRRVRSLAALIGRRIGAGEFVERAAELAKADLMTAMVGEFPELQGTMGRYYAAAQGEAPEVAEAIGEHYRPRFAGDSPPVTRTGQALALADKIDTLVGIFAIDQKPTGAKDPFGLRRAAIGVLRILLEGRLDLDLPEVIEFAAAAQPVSRPGTAEQVLAFITERLRGLVLERDDGTTAEMLDAVLASRPRSPLDAAARLAALKDFLQMPDSHLLTAANKRIANILKKVRLEPGVAVDSARFTEEAERRLHEALVGAGARVSASIGESRYTDSLLLLGGLRGAVDGFFEQVMVMDEDPGRRSNRLALLRDAQTLLCGVADLSRLPG